MVDSLKFLQGMLIRYLSMNRTSAIDLTFTSPLNFISDMYGYDEK